MKFKVIGFLLTVLLGACSPAARPAAPAVPVVQKEIVYVVVTATPEATPAPAAVPASAPTSTDLVEGCEDKLRVRWCVQEGGKMMVVVYQNGGSTTRLFDLMDKMMKVVDPDQKQFDSRVNFIGTISQDKAEFDHWSCWAERPTSSQGGESYWCKAK